MNNLNLPSMPLTLAMNENEALSISEFYGHDDFNGFTKREQACITLGIPETGDPDLDDLIKKSERKRISIAAMGAYLDGNLSWTNGVDGRYKPTPEEVAKESISYADALLKELSK